MYAKDKENYFSSSDINHYDKNIILAFLRKGKCCFGWMSYWEDNEDGLFLPEAYMTMGEWMWPDYLRVFLENDVTINLEKEFINYVEKNINQKLDCSLKTAESFYFNNKNT